MSLRHVVLALLMLAVTYPSRALPLLVPGVERLPGWAVSYLRLVGPAVLAALAATTVFVDATPSGSAIHVDVTAFGVAACVVVVALRRNLFLGLALAAGLVALVRTPFVG